jgi:glycosyltransferase involved in cell wall biosynthesis
MQFSILINTHNQEKYIFRCIDSCLKQTYLGNYEILIFDTSKVRNIKINNYLKYKNIKYFYSKSFSKIPELNQIIKVKKLLLASKGKIICLLDGDDFFCKDKLKKILKISDKINNNLYQNFSYNYLEYKKKYNKILFPFYKKYLFYRYIINDWPFISGTSSLFFDRKILKEFFRKIDIFKYCTLAIDIKLLMFARKFFQIKYFPYYLTFKSTNNYNLSNNYNKIFSLNFWGRRVEQTKFEENFFICKFNLNYLINKLLSFIIRFKSH